MLRKLETNATAERILDVTVRLIDEKKGVHQVNLRQIAQFAGCAHTNVYNYFENFEGLLWAAWGRIIALWQEYVQAHVRPDLPATEHLFDFIAVYIEFALEHTGWFRCLWLDPLFGDPPAEILAQFQNLRNRFLERVIQASTKPLTAEQADQIEMLLHGYVHGEVCKLLTGRLLVPDRQAYQAQILNNFRHLFQLLMQS
jgi:AcrR family transcriptional regulator